MNNDNSLALHLEPLEARTLLAGNVNAVLTGAGDLRINGDAQANDILVDTATPGMVTIEGQNGTTVNGVTGPVNISLGPFLGSLPDDVVINLRAGDDKVVIGSMSGTTSIRDQLVIITGAGEDTVGVYDVMASDLRVISGAGEDAIAVVRSSIVDTLFISTGGSQDAVYFDCSFASNNARIVTGSGDDGIFFASSATKLLMVTGGGNDLVALGNTLLGVDEGRFILGGGNDLVAASDSASFGANPVIGGGGEDTVIQGPSFSFQDKDLNAENRIVSTDANDLAVATVLAFQAEWSVRGMSPLIFVC